MYLNSGFEELTKLSYLSYASCGQIYLRMMQGAFMHFTRRYVTSILLVCIEIASRRVMPTFTYLPVRNIVEQGESFSTTWKPFSVRWQKHPFILPIGVHCFGDILNTCTWSELRFLLDFAYMTNISMNSRWRAYVEFMLFPAGWKQPWRFEHQCCLWICEKCCRGLHAKLPAHCKFKEDVALWGERKAMATTPPWTIFGI